MNVFTYLHIVLYMSVRGSYSIKLFYTDKFKHMGWFFSILQVSILFWYDKQAITSFLLLPLNDKLRFSLELLSPLWGFFILFCTVFFPTPWLTLLDIIITVDACQCYF